MPYKFLIKGTFSQGVYKQYTACTQLAASCMVPGTGTLFCCLAADCAKLAPRRIRPYPDPLEAMFWIQNHWFRSRIRIQHPRPKTEGDPDSYPGFWWPKTDLWVIFGPNPWIRIHWPDWIRIRNTAEKCTNEGFHAKVLRNSTDELYTYGIPEKKQRTRKIFTIFKTLKLKKYEPGTT